jgi:hypothetical protein
LKQANSRRSSSEAGDGCGESKKGTLNDSSIINRGGQTMKVMKVKNIFTGNIHEAEWRTNHAASSYGQPVLVLKESGDAVDAIFFEILPDEDLLDPRD